MPPSRKATLFTVEHSRQPFWCIPGTVPGLARDRRAVAEVGVGVRDDDRDGDSTRAGCNKAFKAALRAAGLPNIRYHDLRHTAATLLLAQGVDPRTIMETLGHSQISLTMNSAP